MKKIDVGISACLLGDKVRYTGEHKQSSLCLHHLSRVFEFQSFCPEVAIGLGVPREPIRMVGDSASPRVVGTLTPSLDVTDALADYGRSVGERNDNLCGYILIERSPSCGLHSTPIYHHGNPLPGGHAGMFVRALQSQNPLLPMEEEGRLGEPALRENFIVRVFAYADWKQSVETEPSVKKLTDFHARYHYLLMAYPPAARRQLARIIDNLCDKYILEVAESYISTLMRLLGTVVSGGVSSAVSNEGHVHALKALLGSVQTEVSETVYRRCMSAIKGYGEESMSLSELAVSFNTVLPGAVSGTASVRVYLAPYLDDLGIKHVI